MKQIEQKKQTNCINQITELNKSNQSLFSQLFPWGEIPYLTLGKKCLKISYKRPVSLKGRDDIDKELDLVLEDLEIALPYFRGKLLKTDHEEGIQSFYFSLEQVLPQSYGVLNPASGKYEIVDFIETYQTEALAERALEIMFGNQYYSQNYNLDSFSVSLLDGETEIRIT
ncbi:MAG: hypothetical protein ACTSYI_06130 [Promethearchaeota archaeon]